MPISDYERSIIRNAAIIGIVCAVGAAICQTFSERAWVIISMIIALLWFVVLLSSLQGPRVRPLRRAIRDGFMVLLPFLAGTTGWIGGAAAIGYGDVVIDNATGAVVTVRLDGGDPVMLAPGDTERVRLMRGSHTWEATRVDGADTDRGAGEVTWGSTHVLNPFGAGRYVRTQVTYHISPYGGGRPAPTTPAEGRWIEANEDYVLEPTPSSVSSSGGREVRSVFRRAPRASAP